MTQAIPANPEVLKWARTTAGLSIEEVVLKLKRKTIGEKIIAEWEEGESSPGYSQFFHRFRNINHHVGENIVSTGYKERRGC